jgi:hypothetical protein
MYVSKFQNLQVTKVTTFRRYKFPSYKILNYKVPSYKIPDGHKALNGYNLGILQHGNFDILTIETNPPIPTLAVSRIPSLYGLLYWPSGGPVPSLTAGPVPTPPAVSCPPTASLIKVSPVLCMCVRPGAVFHIHYIHYADTGECEPLLLCKSTEKRKEQNKSQKQGQMFSATSTSRSARWNAEKFSRVFYIFGECKQFISSFRLHRKYTANMYITLLQNFFLEIC